MGLACLQTLAIASAEDVRGDHQLISTQARLAGDFVGVDIDQLDHPVGVRAAGRGNQVGDRLSADLHRRGQRIRDEDRDVRTSRLLPLVVDQPFRPGHAGRVAHGLDGPRAVGHGFGRVGDVFVEGRVAGLRCGEAELLAGREIERLGLNRAAARAPRRPGWQASPVVGSGVERSDGGNCFLGRFILEIAVEERAEGSAAGNRVRCRC